LGDWESGYADANGIRLHYTRTGGSKPPLVLAHGVTDSGLCWTPLAAALAADYDVIMVDARGHGRSQETESGYDPGTQADDLAGLIAALGLQKPAILGHSMGAATALVLAGNHPDVPGAILLEDPPSWWTPWYDTPDARERVAGMREQAMARKAMPRAELIADQRSRQPGWSDAELEPWADAKQSISLNVLSVFEPDNPRAVDWAAVLPRITCPVLLIASDPELGGIVTDESAALLKELVPQTEVVHVPQAGHNIRRDQFTRYLEVVREFLEVNVAAPALTPNPLSHCDRRAGC
jgi:N-formylmaleamate deformylase